MKFNKECKYDFYLSMDGLSIHYFGKGENLTNVLMSIKKDLDNICQKRNISFDDIDKPTSIKKRIKENNHQNDAAIYPIAPMKWLE